MSEPIKWSAAPDRTSWGASMRVADIALDRDHTLTLFCEADQTAKVDAMFSEVERLRAELARLTKRLEYLERPGVSLLQVIQEQLQAPLPEPKEADK